MKYSRYHFIDFYIAHKISDNNCSYQLFQFTDRTDTVDEKILERTDAKGAAMTVRTAAADSSTAGTKLTLLFRDLVSFPARLRILEPSATATTQVAPSVGVRFLSFWGFVAEATRVERVVFLCMKRDRIFRDPIYIYICALFPTKIPSPSSSHSPNVHTNTPRHLPQHRGNDTTLYFVLGKQPFGQFPPSWDVGLDKIYVGDHRRIVVPPVLTFGSKGFPRRNIPPDAYLQYDVTLVSLNRLATP